MSTYMVEKLFEDGWGDAMWSHQGYGNPLRFPTRKAAQVEIYIRTPLPSMEQPLAAEKYRVVEVKT